MTTQLSDKLIAVEVPQDATNFFINNVGCIRYEQGNWSRCIEPQEMGVYLDKENYSILGLCSPTEIGFDCTPYVQHKEISSYDFNGLLSVDIYRNYLLPESDYEISCDQLHDPVDSFRSLLQSKSLDAGKNYLIIEKI